MRRRALSGPVGTDGDGPLLLRRLPQGLGLRLIPFAMFAAKDLTITGPLLTYQSQAKRGIATRNSCAKCGGLVFGGILGQSDSHTIYGGSFDDPARFVPRIAIFASRAPEWAMIPPGLIQFEEMPS